MKTAVMLSGRLDAMVPRVNTMKPCSAEYQGSKSCTRHNHALSSRGGTLKHLEAVLLKGATQTHTRVHREPCDLTRGKGSVTSQLIPPTSTTLGIRGRGNSSTKSSLHVMEQHPPFRFLPTREHCCTGEHSIMSAALLTTSVTRYRSQKGPGTLPRPPPGTAGLCCQIASTTLDTSPAQTYSPATEET